MPRPIQFKDVQQPTDALRYSQLTFPLVMMHLVDDMTLCVIGIRYSRQIVQLAGLEPATSSLVN